MIAVTEIDSERESVFELRVITTGPNAKGVYTSVPCNQRGERVPELESSSLNKGMAIMGALRNVIR